MNIKSVLPDLAYGKNFKLPHRIKLDLGVLGEQECNVLFERHNREPDVGSGSIEVTSVSWKGLVITADLPYEVLEDIAQDIAGDWE